MATRRVVGVDAGGTKLLAGVVDEGLSVQHRAHRLWRTRERGEVLDLIVEVVEEARSQAPDVEAVGFGIPCLMDFARGVSLSSVHLPLEGVPFRDLMSERLGLPVYVDNDANAAALAEQRHGAAQGASDMVLLTLGTGIGGGLVLGGDVYRGSFGTGAELGHMVVDLDGPLCGAGCPNRGCLEAVASGTAIGREGVEAARLHPDSLLARAAAEGRAITGAMVTELGHDGDSAAVEVLGLVGRRLGAGLSGIANIFNPEVIVIGGGVTAAGELLLGPAREEMMRRALAPNRERVRVVPVHFGAESGMLGAALMALDGSPAA